MSTRAQIGFYREVGDSLEADDQVFVYIHHDGSPEAILPLLENFCREFEGVRGLNDTTYATARYIQTLGNHLDKSGKTFISLGVDTMLHGDIDYFYRVCPTEILVMSRKFGPLFDISDTVQLS